MKKLHFIFPHPLALLIAGIALAAVLTWLVPAGKFERRTVELDGTKREVVLPGTYARTAAHPVGPFAALVAVPKGIINAADVVAFVFLVGGAFTVVDKTGALRAGVDALARKLGTTRWLVIPLVSLLFALGGILENMEEEIIALVPVLLLLCRRLGYDPLTAVAMSIGSSLVGAAFSPMNPFMSLIGQRVSEVALFSGWQYRTVFLVLAQTLWIAGTMRHAAAAHRLNPNHNPNPQPPESAPTSESKIELTPPPRRHATALVLALVAVAFVAFIYGVLKLGWSFEEMTAVFFAMGLLAGLVGGLGVNGTARAFVEGFQAMAFAALLIGFARGIRQVLDDGGVIDTVVLGLFTPLAGWPRAFAAAGMVLVQTLVHIPVPSVSGQAVLTLPILNPLADLLGLSRQVIVLAYQYGGGICGVWSPTNGSLLAILGASGVAYGRWLRFALPLCGLLLALGILAVVLAVMIGLQ
ncbi:MAG: YfcC family protein [Verrucomicrobia bacterium]|nr:YfcC family protein [Verrucomicrobiota bacterium]